MIFVYPVYMFVEFIFFLANNITDDYIGFSIILLSITVNVICLPIYDVAERWQEKERTVQKKLKPKIADIRAVFSGDERYMVLTTYYRQNRIIRSMQCGECLLCLFKFHFSSRHISFCQVCRC